MPVTVAPMGPEAARPDELNLKAANLRAEIVGKYLESKGFTVNTKQWSSEHPMQRPYQDDAPQELNRTVFIDLKNAGKCNLGGLGR